MKSKEQYFYTVDFLRGIGALIILVWHYHHFYFTEAYFQYSGNNPTWIFEIQPYYEYLKYFYHHGGLAVQFFWMLSGFVFANVYLKSNVTFKKFFVNRFARLYPLHFITLISITIFQFLNLYTVGHYQIVSNIDIYHFILHLFFASNWGFEESGTYSFNSVIWSVSLEVLVYGIFFVLLKYIKRYPLFVTMAIMAFSFVLQVKYGALLECVFYFFSGMFIYLLIGIKKVNSLMYISLFMIITSYFLMYFSSEIILILRSVNNKFVVLEYILKIYIFKISLMLFMGGIILMAAYFDLKGYFQKLNSFFSLVGNNTYSTYLWHLPIQILILLFIEFYSIDRSIFNNNIVFIIWIVCISIVGRISYIYIEKPTKKSIKKKLL